MTDVEKFKLDGHSEIMETDTFSIVIHYLRALLTIIIIKYEMLMIIR